MTGLLQYFGVTSPTDRIAAIALLVATAALLVSLIPAVTSIVQASAASAERRAAREAAEPAVNVSVMVPSGWPAHFIELRLHIKNRSDFFIEARKARLRTPRQLTMAFVPKETMFNAAQPFNPEHAVFARNVDLGNTLIRELGAVAFSGSSMPTSPDNQRDFRLALKVPKHLQRPMRIKMLVDVARSNRHLKSTSVPVHFDIEEWVWQAERT